MYVAMQMQWVSYGQRHCFDPEASVRARPVQRASDTTRQRPGLHCGGLTFPSETGNCAARVSMGAKCRCVAVGASAGALMEAAITGFNHMPHLDTRDGDDISMQLHACPGHW